MDFKEQVNFFSVMLFICVFGFVFLSACAALDGSRKSDAALSNHDPRTAVQLRTALKRLKEIMEGKSQVFTSSLCPTPLQTLVLLYIY